MQRKKWIVAVAQGEPRTVEAEHFAVLQGYALFSDGGRVTDDEHNLRASWAPNAWLSVVEDDAAV